MDEKAPLVTRIDTTPSLSLVAEDPHAPAPLSCFLKSRSMAFHLMYYPGQTILDMESGWLTYYCIKFHNPLFFKKEGKPQVKNWVSSTGFEIKTDNSPAIATPKRVYVHGDYYEYAYKPHLYKIGDVAQANDFLVDFRKALEEMEQFCEDNGLYEGSEDV